MRFDDGTQNLCAQMNVVQALILLMIVMLAKPETRAPAQASVGRAA
jgi:hypothetical protein